MTMQTTTRDEEAIDRFRSAFDHDWHVDDYGTHLLVTDFSSRTWTEASAVTTEAMDAFDSASEDLETRKYDKRHALFGAVRPYDVLCSRIDSIDESLVPVEIVNEAREDYGIEEDEPVENIA